MHLQGSNFPYVSIKISRPVVDIKDLKVRGLIRFEERMTWDVASKLLILKIYINVSFAVKSLKLLKNS